MNPNDPAGELSPVHQHNRRAWDDRVKSQGRFTKPIGDDALHDPLTKVDAQGWLGGDIRGRQLLCLAAGGGRQSVTYATAGAEVTVVDISPAMLEIDREVAAERGLSIRTVEASMDHLPMLRDGQFDIVIHPVATCYVRDILPVYREVARVIRPGGVYVSQHKQPTSLQTTVQPTPQGYALTSPYYSKEPLPPVVGSRHREEGTLEFLHRWEELIGGLCQAGFVIEDLTEPRHADPQAAVGTFAHRSQFVAPYVRIKARRIGDRGNPSIQGKLWTPEAR